MIKTTWRLFLLLTIITGCIYPHLITAIAQGCFGWQANGSIITDQGLAVGSKWIGQNFYNDAYFWGRPSATLAHPYNGLASGGSNLGPTNPVLLSTIKSRIAEYDFSHHPIPVDLITASASGLDPEISPEAAYYQIPRIAHARQLSESQIRALIESHTQSRTFNILGEPRVNVLNLNLALDTIRPLSPPNVNKP